MSMLKTRKTSKLKVTALSGAVLIGTAYLVLQSYPHIRKSLYQYISGTTSVDSLDEVEDEVEDGGAEETDSDLGERTTTSSARDSGAHGDGVAVDTAELQQWSNTNLRLWLKNKDITPPANATNDKLISLIRSIQSNY